MKIIVMAPKGKMGRLIIKAAAERDDLEIVGVVGPAGRDYIGQDAGRATGLGYDLGVKVTDSLESVIGNCDAVIDFSTVELSMSVLETAMAHKKALVCGTTGFTDDQIEKLHASAAVIPVLHASNTSYVVNLMYRLLAMAASSLAGRADIEIIDMHDRMKKDAPSGTAKEMAAAIAEALDPCTENEIVKFHSVRAGDIPSSHTVIFGCMGERLEISHHAYNWECYAKGACDGVFYLNGKSKGLYTMKDIIV